MELRHGRMLGAGMEPLQEDEPYLDPNVPGFVEDGERFERPVPKRSFTKAVRSIAAVVLAAMLFAAGTPLSWVSIVTAILMLLIWINIGSRDHDDTI
ncbi:MAG: hypothetical protein BMS9Abin12_1988 [Acidimicrobiia bacterium]|nr:MAG: hypothetical protein BMS9Abin12_1988 [Acidimicrobiia bacterium]